MRPWLFTLVGLLTALPACGDPNAAASCQSLFSPAGAALILTAYLGGRLLRRKPRPPT